MKKIIILAIIIIGLSMFFIWQNNSIVISEINYNNPKLPDEFKGYKIAHISDLHNKMFGKDQKPLLKKIQRSSPDIIVVTGDLIDRRKYDLNTAMVFIKGAMEIAPVYYVSGNHEAWSGDYENIKSELYSAGVEILHDKKVEIIKNQEKIEILGLSDPGFMKGGHRDGAYSFLLEERLKNMADESIFQILLCHRPELFNIYINQNIDLIFSGHAHGGQFRIPFIGGLVAPNQGLFPKYTSGAHKEGNSTLVISRGLGNSVVPIRIFNRPEIVLVTLEN